MKSTITSRPITYGVLRSMWINNEKLSNNLCSPDFGRMVPKFIVTVVKSKRLVPRNVYYFQCKLNYPFGISGFGRSIPEAILDWYRANKKMPPRGQ